MTDIEEKAEEIFEDIYDPELHVDIWSLGLIYEINVEDDVLDILMTLTFPGCPYGPEIIEEVEERLGEIDEIEEVDVEVTFDPAWSPDKIDDDIRAALGM